MPTTGALIHHVYVEVLRTTASLSAPAVPVSASSSFALAGASKSGGDFHKFAAHSLGFANLVVSGGDFEVSGLSAIVVSSNGIQHNTGVYVSATTGLGLSDRLQRAGNKLVAGFGSFGFTDLASATRRAGASIKSVSASTTIALTSASGNSARRLYYPTATTTIGIVPTLTVANWAKLRVAAFTTIGLSPVGSEVRNAKVAGTNTVRLAAPTVAVRDIACVAITTLGLSQPARSNGFRYGPSAGSLAFTLVATAELGNPTGVAGIRFNDLAVARVTLPVGGGVPGIRAAARSAGAAQKLASFRGDYPASFAETQSGLILIANGINPVVRWDALDATADSAGVVPPAAGVSLGGVNVGTIIGRRVAYVRFVDRWGNYSNLSPVSNAVDFGRDALIDRVSYDAAGLVSIASAGHGLATGEVVVIAGVEGIPAANGTFQITRVDDDRFTLDGLNVTAGRYRQGGYWTWGVQTVGYSDVPVPSEPKVVRRQILRNLAGNMDVFYVDIDTDDVTATAFVSEKPDEVLAGGEAVAFSFDDDLPAANRFGVPPAHKAVVATHQGRVFAAVDVTVNDGHCEVALDSTTVTGVGTSWNRSFAGRMLYVVGASRSYEIASVDEAEQTLTLVDGYGDKSDPFAEYAIRPAPAERRLVYYTEPQMPEAWPPWNAVSLPEDSDEITGLMQMGSFLYVTETRNAYRLTFQNDPATDGFLFRSVQRGCLNNRLFAIVEGTAYMLDAIGIHAFDGQDSRPISTPIQNLFQQGLAPGLQVNWEADTRYWHAAHDPNRDTIRWFVAMSGMSMPRHALCYNYRAERWWVEEYPHEITASTVATIGYRRSLVGTQARRILCLNEGSLDGVDAAGAIRGAVTTAGPLTLVDASAPFPPNLAGASLAIAGGKGAVQERRIVDNTTDTLTIDRPWLELPDGTSTYQVGGIAWEWQSGWFRYADDEQANPRDVEVVYQPLKRAGSLDMRLYFDHGDDPRNWGVTRKADGVQTTAGRPDITVDLTTRSGWAMQRMDGRKDIYAPGDRFVSVALRGVQAGELVRVYSVTINGVK